ncbi:MAG: IMP dehydrogenase [Armatimonadetes bacterium]|nr:IMP dehydrogenase [Armatimonadota bacterium]
MSESWQERVTIEGLSMDDVLLVPGYADVLPDAVDVRTHLTARIPLNIPILSSAMDTVTEARLAIALAQEGGLGVIHRNMRIEEQVHEVDKVKRSESGMIVDPVTLTADATLQEALDLMARYKVSGVPITAADGLLVGILTNRDVRFVRDYSQPVSAYMTSRDLVTVREHTSLQEAEQHLHEHRIEKLLVVDENYHLRGLITVKDIQKVVDFPNACKDDLGRLRVGAAVGTGDKGLERAEKLVEAQVDALFIDTAHGYSRPVMEALREFKRRFGADTQVVVGNVATYDGARALIDAGADGIKVGMGPGSICTTRIVSGAGMPQITAVFECARAAEGTGVPVIADGGIRYSGDITKVLAAGADSAMIGGLLAGTEESPGETVLFEGRTYKEYRGMGSLRAMKAGSDRYPKTAQGRDDEYVPEGIEGRVPYKGSLKGMVFQLVGGIRAGMGYCGVTSMAELRTKTTFTRVTAAGMRESHAHDVTITREAPNYQVR